MRRVVADRPLVIARLNIARTMLGRDTSDVHTSEAVLAAVQGLHEAQPAKQTLTLKEIEQALEPEQVALAQTGQVDSLLWEESLSNTLKQLGREGQLTVDLVTDDRGYQNPVVRFS